MGGSVKRNVSLVRVLSILRLMEQRGRHTLLDLAHRFDAHPRTVRRDLEALEAAGYPIGHEERGADVERVERGTWWLA